MPGRRRQPARLPRAPRPTGTALFGTNGTLAIGPALYKNLQYDPVNDLAPVGAAPAAERAGIHPRSRPPPCAS
jgi:hypothetical protein